MTDLVAQVRRHLNDIPELTLEASYYLTPGTAPKDPDARHGTTIYKIPIVAEIADLLDIREKDVEEPGFNRMVGERRLGVLPTLELWVSLIYAELDDMGLRPRDCCPPRNHTITGETLWLSDYAETIIDLHPDFPHDIETLWLELRKACRIRRKYNPKCPQCGHYVQGIHGSEEDLCPAWYQCTGCHRTWVHDAELQRLAATQPRMPLRAIASLLKLPEATLRYWRQQGRFNPDSKGLYELEHVKRAAQSAGRTA